MIDNFALRVGNEKGEDQADTVGLTNLRVEHVKFMDNNKISLDFLGKDSIRYKNTHVVNPDVYNNLFQFVQNKSNKDQLFDKIDSNSINKYLQGFMKGLTAKVFRTYNASNLFRKELDKVNKRLDSLSSNNNNNNSDDTIKILLQEFNKANAKVALLCNHQKTVSKTFDSQMDKIDNAILKSKNKIKDIQKDLNKNTKNSKKYNERIRKIKNFIKELKAKKSLKLDTKKISLETSKANYIDPRITVAFIKKHNLPVDKVFSKALQEKFKWAFDVTPEWKF